MAIRFRRRRPVQNEILGTYSFPSRTVQVLRTQDDRILWTCDCERFRRQGEQREPLWCKHIAKAAARRSLERLTRRVAVPRGTETESLTLRSGRDVSRSG
ncbi:MAG TPA: hypothetical protein VK800_11760 [Steroidobacteraceae bacterium]|jgi:hypothetical protein|nr:hypothetical protein [Steroidobacteraceae bacterium]